MGNDFLQNFLKTGLFDIGGADDRLEKLKKSIDDLENIFKNDYSLLSKYTLVAIDPNISDTEPALITTEEIVIKHWEMLRSQYSDMPRNILRGVILNALNNVGSNDPIAARIIYLSALNFYPYAKLNQEKELVKTLLTAFGDIAEENAVEAWSLTEEVPSLKMSTLKLNDFKLGNIKINKTQLREDMYDSVQTAENGHGSNHGGASEWGDSFADKSSKGIATVLDSAFSKFNEALPATAIETPINKFFTAFKKSLDENLKTSFQSLKSVERRSKLLWWKETLYSPSLKKSYRGLDINLLPILMGIDLNNQIIEVTPISVDYLLRDTLFLLNDKKDEPIKFIDFFKNISEDSCKAILKPLLELNEEEGRISITDFIALLVNDRISINDFQSRTGIEEKATSSMGEIAVSVLHDLLVQRLGTE
ncbi:MAG: hypothetical protein COB67_09990 [SAR324 cluster bacterium]|uniref:GTPase-associated system helical domain-containing protein n=1 Tax=SAR324 cluster bacterium TaxID=2024889 RepID=A0A2A4SYZ7_9DELT|nr:MAG: hypothetical protein COB67_09990 [SAR324 cluster bacterium]